VGYPRRPHLLTLGRQEERERVARQLGLFPVDGDYDCVVGAPVRAAFLARVDNPFQSRDLITRVGAFR
jgi:hypothetical protein